MKHNENKAHLEPPFRCPSCRKEVIEDMEKIIDDKIAREMDLGKNTKGQAVFQIQCAIDMACEIKEELAVLKAKG